MGFGTLLLPSAVTNIFSDSLKILIRLSLLCGVLSLAMSFGSIVGSATRKD
jgi:hypothetical protein